VRFGPIAEDGIVLAPTAMSAHTTDRPGVGVGDEILQPEKGLPLQTRAVVGTVDTKIQPGCLYAIAEMWPSGARGSVATKAPVTATAWLAIVPR